MTVKRTAASAFYRSDSTKGQGKPAGTCPGEARPKPPATVYYRFGHAKAALGTLFDKLQAIRHAILWYGIHRNSDDNNSSTGNGEVCRLPRPPRTHLQRTEPAGRHGSVRDGPHRPRRHGALRRNSAVRPLGTHSRNRHLRNRARTQFHHLHPAARCGTTGTGRCRRDRETVRQYPGQYP